MVQYRDLNAPPQQTFAEIVAAMQDQAKSSKTGAAGVKDLGDGGDVVWPRPDGEVASIRDVDLELADARQRIEDAEGDLAGAQARIDTALDAEGHVREDEILRNATLLGETVVEQINVTGKLVGTDGVFTGTVDFANVNVTGELLASQISGEHIYGTVIEGGEIRTSSDETRGSFLLSDGAYVNPDDGYVTPGLRFTPPNSTYVHQPAVGVIGGGLRVSGGKSATGALSTLYAEPGGVGARAVMPAGSTERVSRLGVGGATGAQLVSNLVDGSESASIIADLSFDIPGATIPPRAQLIARSGSQRGEIVAYGDGRAQISTGGATPRSLRIDTTGVWVETNRSGTTERWNLEETASDSGWISFTLRSGINGTGSPAFRVKAGIVYFRGIVTTTGNWEQGWTDIAGPFHPRYRPETTVQVMGSMTDDRRTLLRMSPDGVLAVYMRPAIAGTATLPLAPMSYLLG